MKKNKRGQLRQKKKFSYAEIIDNIIPEAQKDPHHQLFIKNLSIEKGYEKRRLYDLFNVLSVYDLCEKSGSNVYIWKGIENMNNALVRIGKEVETEALEGNYQVILKLPEPASLVLIAKRFISVFIFLGANKLQIHDMSTVMAPSTVSPKKILRRLYLVAHILEHLKTLKRTSIIGEYELTFDIRTITERVLNEMQENDEFPPDSLYSRLSRLEDRCINQVYKQRLQTYRLLIESRNHNLMEFSQEQNIHSLDLDSAIEIKALSVS